MASNNTIKRGRIELERQAVDLRRTNERLQSELAKHREMERELRASQQVLEGILDAVPVRVFWKDKDLTLLGCNAAFARDAGFADPKEAIGKTDHQMPWRAQAELYRADDRQVIDSGRAKYLIEEPQTTPSGDTITLLTSKVPLRGPDGTIHGVLGTYMDVTDRKRAEEALRASEIRYRRLFESAKDGILILDAETGMVVDVNPFLVDLLGYSHEEFLAKQVWELGSLRDVVANEANFTELRDKGYIRYEDRALESRDGQRIEVEFVSNVYLVNEKKVIQCNIRDISARRRIEESHALLAAAVEQAAETIMITDPDGTILFVNPAFETTSGYSREEGMGQTPWLFETGLQGPEFYQEMWSVLGRGDVWRGHFVNRRKDGDLFEEEASIAPIHDIEGRIVNYVAVKRNVTEERRLAQQLAQSQRMEAVGRLAGGVAHDFNNLLGVIMGYAEVVQEKLVEDDPHREAVEQILAAGERAASLTRQLLAFSRQQVLQPTVLDLESVVAEMSKLLHRLIGTGVELHTRVGPKLGSVMADRGQIEQVLLNLAVNARDAMPDGGRITIETQNAEIDAAYAAKRGPARPGRYVMLSFTDTGTGMDQATQRQIFEPFFTTKAAGDGTGLGLATVFGIVQQSGGFICVDSELGAGTTFRIYLPRIANVVEAAQEGTPGQASMGRGNETVLVVEDELALRELLCGILEAAGYSVLCAADGAEALRVAGAHAGSIELMVTDVIMPRLTGFRLAELLATSRPEMKVLFLSGRSDESVKRHGLVDDGRAFLGKPFALDALRRRVRKLLDSD